MTDLELATLQNLVDAYGVEEIAERVKECAPELACPECGDDRHLYRKCDHSWNPDAREWEAGDLEDGVECTECDWSGFVTDLTVQA